MPSNNSYTYYRRFLRCLKQYLDKKVEERKENHKLFSFSNDDDGFNEKILFCYEDENRKTIPIYAGAIYSAFAYVLDNLIKKAPSASMGGDDWLDKFFVGSVKELCSGTWCKYERCIENSNEYPYYCKAGNIPNKCEAWKKWRLSWRSYPEKEACQKCKHYKPEAPSEYRSDLQTKKINEYKCYCRAKELPEDCPKKKKEKK